MSNLGKKIEFKVIVCVIIQLFILNNICFAGALDEEKYKQEKTLSQDCPGEDIKPAQATPATTGYSGLSTQGYNSSSAEQTVDYGSVADNLTDCDLSTKCSILQSAGANEAETATTLIGKGHDPEDVKNVMVDASFDAQKTGEFLDSIISGQEQISVSMEEIAVSAEEITQEFTATGDTSTPPNTTPGTLVMVVGDIHYTKNNDGNWISNQQWSSSYDPQINAIIITSPYFNSAQIQGDAMDVLLQSFEGNTQQEKYDNMMAEDPDHLENLVQQIAETGGFNNHASSESTASENTGEYIATLSALPENCWSFISINSTGNGDFSVPSEEELAQGLKLVKVENGVKTVYVRNKMGNKWIKLYDTVPTTVTYSPETGITLYDPDFVDCNVKIQGEALTLLLESYEGDTEQEKFDNLMASDSAFFDDMLKSMSYNCNIALKQSSDPNESAQILATFEVKLGDLLSVIATLPDDLKAHISFYHDVMYY